MRLSSIRLFALIVVLASVSPLNSGAADGMSADNDRWRFDDYRIVPAAVHLLRSAQAPAANTRLNDDDVLRIMRKVNTIWGAAGVQFRIASIAHEEASAVAGHELDAEIPTSALPGLRLVAAVQPNMFNVYYISSMAPNGIFMGVNAIFVKDTAMLQTVKGGIDEPLPRVTAHELGHGMGLPHRQSTFNLMASGTTGTSLNDAEIEIVRTGLAHVTWAETPRGCLTEADAELAKGHTDVARKLYRAIADLPGGSPIKTRAVTALKGIDSKIK